MYNFRLPYQEKDEKTLLVLRRFWPVFFRFLLFILFLLALPFVVYLMVLNFTPEFLETKFFQILGLFFGLYWLFILLYALISWINYYFDVWVITNRRVINIEQVSLFERVTSETRLERIQDVTVEVRGFLPSVFHFGNVYIQTAGERPRFTFEQIRHPYRVRKLISDLHRKVLREREAGHTKPIRFAEDIERVEKEEKLGYPKVEERFKRSKEEKKPTEEIKPEEPKPEKPKSEEPQEGLGEISDYRK